MVKFKNMLKENYFIITGGPGSGKTTLIHELEKLRIKCVPEVARVIIKEQMASRGKALPWEDTTLYSKLMIERSVDDFRKYQNHTETLIFDRGIPDTIGYMELIQLSPSPEYQKLANEYRYNKKVFILPPWEEIYAVDSERKQNFNEAVRTYNQLSQTYLHLGYELIILPKVSVGERAKRLISELS